MSFVSDLRTIMIGDVSINNLITGGINFGHLSDDFDITKSWIAYDFKILEQINFLNSNKAYTTYSIAITVTATDSVVMNNICDLVINYLNNKTTSHFIDIVCMPDSKITTLSKPVNTYQNILEFNAIYID